jgi:hypothetical protein
MPIQTKAMRVARQAGNRLAVCIMLVYVFILYSKLAEMVLIWSCWCLFRNGIASMSAQIGIKVY